MEHLEHLEHLVHRDLSAMADSVETVFQMVPVSGCIDPIWPCPGKLVLESDFSETVLQLHHFIEELRDQIVQLRERVAILEGGGGLILTGGANPGVVHHVHEIVDASAFTTTAAVTSTVAARILKYILGLISI